MNGNAKEQRNARKPWRSARGQILDELRLNRRTAIEILEELRLTNRKLETIMSDVKDLDAVIAALPGNIAAAVEAEVQPIIDAIKAKGGPDLAPEIAALGNIGQTVADKVSQDLAAANPTGPDQGQPLPEATPSSATPAPAGDTASVNPSAQSGR